MSIAHIYLSPHLDDAVLSCGGTIHRQTQAGESVLVVNVCAATPDYRSLSPFAREKHAMWGSPEDVIATRRAEDRQALAALGAQVVYWEYLDAIYRTDAQGRTLYSSLKAIFADLDPADAGLVEQLAGEIAALCEAHPGAVLYAPLAVGHHVDHQLVRGAALRIAQRDHRMWFYEDFPYAWWDPEGVQEALHELEAMGDWECQVWPIDVEPKIRAIARYRTQIPDLFGTEELMADAVREYAASFTGKRGYAERFWRRRG